METEGPKYKRGRWYDGRAPNSRCPPGAGRFRFRIKKRMNVFGAWLYNPEISGRNGASAPFDSDGRWISEETLDEWTANVEQEEQGDIAI